jgi:hypothetical protein
MFLHIDEPGNSGNNLFDQNQPVLSYGALSSRWDVDAHSGDERKATVNMQSPRRRTLLRPLGSLPRYYD